MNKLPEAKRAAIIRCLIEGTSIRATARITGTSKDTLLKLLVEVGEFASFYQNAVLRNLSCTKIEADEIWAHAGAKKRNATKEGQADIWTFTAVDPDSKLMVSWLVGSRTEENCTLFLRDLADRVTGRIQLSTDGHGMYLSAVRKAFDFRTVIMLRSLRFSVTWSAWRTVPLLCGSLHRHQEDPVDRQPRLRPYLNVEGGAHQLAVENVQPSTHAVDERFLARKRRITPMRFRSGSSPITSSP